MRLPRASGLLAAIATTTLANWYNGTTYPATLVPKLTAQDLCPDSCPTTSSLEPGSWSTVLSLEELDRCKKPVLFRTSVRFHLEADDRPTFIQACTVPSSFVDAKFSSPACVALWSSNQTISTKVDLQVGSSNDDTGAGASLSQVLAAAAQLQKAVSSSRECGAKILFVKYGSAVLGLYAGAEVDRNSVAKVLQEYIQYADGLKTGLPAELAVQACGGSKGSDAFKSAAHIVGIFASTKNGVEAVHNALGQWAQAKCVSIEGETKDVIPGKRIAFLSGPAVTAASRKQMTSVSSRPKLFRRDDACTKYVLVESGDTCESLASRCGIAEAAFVHFNGGSGDGGEDDTFCSDLQIDTPMCCDAGSKPDLSPQENSDGSCVYTVVEANDLCINIEKKYYLQSNDLDKFNVGKTWGWAGCEKLIPGQKICVSEGSPPMPTWIKNAVCGPQKPGTVRSSVPGLPLTDYNYCPINACCDIWGQCGTTAEFCTNTTVNGTPGTAANGTNGCVSNCGMDVVSNAVTPPEFFKVGYFEAWNYQRKCLHMDVTQVPNSYTHIHFAFGDISADDWVVSANGIEEQFDKLIGLTGVKRIMSLGGWAFSNDGNTSAIMRDGVMPDNRQAFADNVVSFVQDNDLDGIDFDWEYPGATDIAGADQGTPEDGTNYLEFLKLVRSGLGNSKSISISTPASYWYLRNFPVLELASVIDYTVFMTYDFHGQWDVGNKYVESGCPEGNCLRSPVNRTETFNALSMMTKAGMPADKILVGVSSYGRSFKMDQAGCYGPSCHYLGGYDESPAEPGNCTETNGYLAGAEIDSILADKSRVVTSYHDGESDSDILVYDEVQWVGYMSNATKQSRRETYKSLNFLGTSDWAVDLQKNGDDGGGNVVYIGTGVYTSPTMHCTAPCTIVLAPSPLSATTTITIPPYTTSLAAGTDTVTVTISPKPITTDQVPFYQISITSNEPSTPIQPYPSVSVPDATVTFTYTTEGSSGSVTGTSTRIVALPPWPLITNGPPPDGSTWAPPTSATTSNSSGLFVWPTDTNQPPTPPPSTTNTAVQTWAWSTYPGTVEPVQTSYPSVECGGDCDPDPGTGLVTIFLPCDIWFFNLCPKGRDDDDGIKGIKLEFPPGIVGPGPPPPWGIKLPTGWSIFGKLPPWPKLKIPDTNKGGEEPDVPEDEPDDCETESASICGTTTSYGSSVDSGGSTVTTASSTYSTCYTVYGCEEEDSGSSTTEGSGDSCTSPAARRALSARTDVPVVATKTVTSTATRATSAAASRLMSWIEKRVVREEVIRMTQDDKNDVVEESEVDEDEEDSDWQKRASSSCSPEPVIILPKNIYDTVAIENWLNDRVADNSIANFDSAKGFAGQGTHQYIAWFYIPLFPQNLRFTAGYALPQISLIYNPEEFWTVNGCQPFTYGPPVWDEPVPPNSTSNFTRRGSVSQKSGDYANGFMSTPRDLRNIYNMPSFYDSSSNQYVYQLDDTQGKGQAVYVLEPYLEPGWDQLPEFQGANVEAPITTTNLYPKDSSRTLHGVAVMSVVAGQTIGAAKQATVVPVVFGIADSPYQPFVMYQSFITTLDDILKNSRPASSIVNLSGGIEKKCLPLQFKQVLRQILQIYENAGILVVVAAGNSGHTNTVTQDYWPQELVVQMDSGIVVGSLDRYGFLADSSTRSANGATAAEQIFAAGEAVQVIGPSGQPETSSGTSYAAPRLAALGAYLRGLPSPYQTTLTSSLESGKRLKQMILALQGFLQPSDVPQQFHATEYPKSSLFSVPGIWNGQVPPHIFTPNGQSKSCLLEGSINYPGTNCNVCPDLSRFLPRNNPKRDAPSDPAPACQIPGLDGPGGNIGGVPVPKPIGWSPGDPGPLCETDCGTACEGYFCSPQPIGVEPDFTNPDPSTTSSPPPPPETTTSPPPSGSTGGSNPNYCTPNEPVVDLCQPTSPDPSLNVAHCYNSGQGSNYDAITIAAQDFCRDVVNTKTTWSDYMLYNTYQPQGDDYYFAMSFEVYEGCSWEANYDECLQYLHVPIDSCNCGGTGGKQGGYVTNNCINARVDPNSDV